jgi:transposase-like protein
MPRKRAAAPPASEESLAGFACPNPECDLFNRFNAGNLTVAECAKTKNGPRRLSCRHCGHRFSERQGTLLEGTHLPVETVTRIVKCLAHGCTIEATADICEVDPRSVQRLLAKAGPRADEFHHLQLERIKEVPAAQLDELHGRVSPTSAKKGGTAPKGGPVTRAAVWVVSGFTRRWR